MKTLGLGLVLVLGMSAGICVSQEVPDVAGLMITTCESTNDLHLATAGGVVYLHVPREDAPADKIVVAVRRKSGASFARRGPNVSARR